MSRRARVILVAATALLAMLLAGLNLALRAPDPAAEADWREVWAWDFAAGEPPRGWGWGERQVRDGHLELAARPGELAVCVLPTAHAPDFVLAAEFMLVADADTAGPPVAALLATRDERGATHDSGCLVRAGTAQASVHHRVNHKPEVLALADLAETPERGRWYSLRITVYGGRLTVHLDGAPVYATDERCAQGLYCEPYLAAESGTVWFRRFRVLEAPRASGPVS